MAKAVLVESLHVALPGRGEVLRGVSLALGAGEVLGLVGPNGAGKSTLVRTIAGLLPIQSGTVLLGGTELSAIARPELAKRVGYLVQEMPAGLPFTAAEVVLMGRSPHLGPFGLDGPADRALALSALERVEASALGSRRLDALSGGERRRIMLAKLLAQEAPLWLLDEPTAHLDLAHQHLAMRLARAHADEGGSVLCVLHDLTQAAALCDRVIVLQEGAVAASGPPSEALEPQLLEEVFRVPFATLVDPRTGAPSLHPLPELRRSSA